MKKISVIVPVYNVEQYLEECLHSIVNQTYWNLEIILVDDGSTDKCPEICDRYARKDDRINVIHKENGGLSDARNAGMEIMSGDYVVFVDSDDYIAVDMIEGLAQIACEYNADIVECGFIKTESSATHPIASRGENDAPPRVYSEEQALESLMLHELQQVVWNKLYSAPVINGINFETDRINEDEFWTYQVFGRAGKVASIERDLYFYRQQPGSIMNRNYSIRRLDGLVALENRMKYMEEHFPNLLPLAKKTFCFGSMFHYQMLLMHQGVDPSRIYRKQIVEKVGSVTDKEFLSTLSLKQTIWLRLFLLMPGMTCTIRNQFKIGL